MQTNVLIYCNRAYKNKYYQGVFKCTDQVYIIGFSVMQLKDEVQFLTSKIQMELSIFKLQNLFWKVAQWKATWYWKICLCERQYYRWGVNEVKESGGFKIN